MATEVGDGDDPDPFEKADDPEELTDQFFEEGADGDVDVDDAVADGGGGGVGEDERRDRGGLRASHGGEGGDANQQHAVIKCSTTAGDVTMHLHRAWSPNGYDRATALFERGYYDHSHLFRVVPHFLVQFGISYINDEELKRFADSTIMDDPRRGDLMPFREGYISFAGSGPNSRGSQLFIAYDKAGGLGQSPWETPFGEVTEGIDTVRNFYSEYGDMPPWGKGPQQGPIRNQGPRYIEEEFPLLDKFQTCTVNRMDSTPLKETVIQEKRHSSIGGSVVKADILKHQVSGSPNNSAPREMNAGVAPVTQLPLIGKIIIVAFLVLVLGRLIARRKKSKRDGKTV